ncbi:unnamed protein product [Meloidogyne enterolobii]|uniref:Uncharacterized protein n=1 Tax=Meloidogyne enterolobii TaxID=390850 RepID=A0ACB0YH54_MELEN
MIYLFYYLFSLLQFVISIDEQNSSDLSINNTNKNEDIQLNITNVGGTFGCPAFSSFKFWVARQCPPMNDTRCMVSLPCDLTISWKLNCGTADDVLRPRMQLFTAQEMLYLTKLRDKAGRPWCLLSFFFSPDCIFSSKVADSFYQIARFYPKLRVVAVDVSKGGKEMESLIAQYGIASTPVLAIWQDGLPRLRLYEDYSKLHTLINVIRLQTDLKPKVIFKNYEEFNESGCTETEPCRQEFLSRFKYLQAELGFDWYLFVASITCILNITYFILFSTKGRELIRQYFPRLRNLFAS